MRRRQRKAVARAIEAAEAANITPVDMSIITLALQSRVRDMHAAGRHEAAEAALYTLNKIHAIMEAAR